MITGVSGLAGSLKRSLDATNTSIFSPGLAELRKPEATPCQADPSRPPSTSPTVMLATLGPIGPSGEDEIE
eukprot:scaffold210496_cov27-Prasinocladus_malaysianus.AAC.2